MENRLEIISRADAKAQGLSTYFTGKPCKNGHIAKRYTGDYKCVEYDKISSKASKAKHKDRVNERWKKWRLANPEKRKLYKHNRRVKEISGGTLSDGLVEKLLILQQGKCPCCGGGNHLTTDFT